MFLDDLKTEFPPLLQSVPKFCEQPAIAKGPYSAIDDDSGTWKVETVEENVEPEQKNPWVIVFCRYVSQKNITPESFLIDKHQKLKIQIKENQ